MCIHPVEPSKAFDSCLNDSFLQLAGAASWSSLKLLKGLLYNLSMET